MSARAVINHIFLFGVFLAVQNRIVTADERPNVAVRTVEHIEAQSSDTASVVVKAHRLGIIGGIEPVVIFPNRVVYDARIDTGAKTSSIDAEEIMPFERNGEEWVRFRTNVREGEDPCTLELPVSRTVLLKRKGAKSVRRYVVKMTIGLGEEVVEREVTLGDRDNFDLTMLIGRNVLQDLAIVDVSKSRTLEPQIEDSK